MRVKICGLRRLEDAQLAIELGATHLGVVLAEDSPRRASLIEAQAIAAIALTRAEVVLVCRGLDDDAIMEASRRTGVQRVQVHDADHARCQRLRERGLNPIPVQRVPVDGSQLPRFAATPTAARPALLDGGAGGAGTTFPWSLLGERAPDAVFVAGGITPANVAQLLRHRPWGIDVSSGVESRPGNKHAESLRELFQHVRAHTQVQQ